MCAEDRIPDTAKIGSYLAIPSKETKPSVERIKSGRYIKEKVDG